MFRNLCKGKGNEKGKEKGREKGREKELARAQPVSAAALLFSAYNHPNIYSIIKGVVWPMWVSLRGSSPLIMSLTTP